MRRRGCYGAAVAAIPSRNVAAAVVLVSAGLLMTAPQPHAEPSSDPGTEFLAMLTKQGFDIGTSGADTELTLSAGERVCHFLHYDYSPEDAAMNLRYRFPNATPEQISGFVQAAQATLCGPAYAPVEQEP